jgi:hypothetical protein
MTERPADARVIGWRRSAAGAFWRDATFLGQRGHHRRRLALLAVLAAAGGETAAGISCSCLAGRQDAARFAGQLLVRASSSLGESVFDGVNPVRLNPAVATRDARRDDDRRGSGGRSLHETHLRAAVKNRPHRRAHERRRSLVGAFQYAKQYEAL